MKITVKKRDSPSRNSIKRVVGAATFIAAYKTRKINCLQETNDRRCITSSHTTTDLTAVDVEILRPRTS